MSQTLLAFDRSVEKDDVAFFFFAGHGFEIPGRNYLLPTDVPASHAKARRSWSRIPPSRSTRSSTGCRRAARRPRSWCSTPAATTRSPGPGRAALPGGGGLMPLNPPEGTFVLFSAGAKQTALDALGDSDPDPNSVFTRHFVRQLATPGMTLVQLAKSTQGEVKQVAARVKHQQTPAYYDEIIGDFVLNTKPGGTPPEVKSAAHARAVTRNDGRRGRSRRLSPPPSQALNAPLASFMRTGSGWTVSVSFIEPVVAVGWRLGETGRYKDTGFLDTLDPRTRRRMRQPELRARQESGSHDAAGQGGRYQRPHRRPVPDHASTRATN